MNLRRSRSSRVRPSARIAEVAAKVKNYSGVKLCDECRDGLRCQAQCPAHYGDRLRK
jgi:hypothetical protein